MWDNADGGLFFFVLGMNVVVQQQQLVCGITEPLEGAGKMGSAGENLGKGGIG